MIVGLAFGPDGALYSASRDKTVRRWFGDGDAVLYGHEEGVTSLALGPDGRTLATGSADDRVGVWRPGSGVEWLVGHSDDIEVVAFSPDGLRVASGSRDKSARIWPAVEGGGPPVVLDGHDKRVLGLAFSPDGEAIVTGSADHTARVWDAGTGELRAVLRGHEQPVYHVRFVGPDRVLTASDDGTARLFNYAEQFSGATGSAAIRTSTFKLIVHKTKTGNNQTAWSGELYQIGANLRETGTDLLTVSPRPPFVSSMCQTLWTQMEDLHQSEGSTWLSGAPNPC